jgi:hypothetical protein
MSTPTALIDWQAQHGSDWNLRPLRMQHHLHESPLFQPAALAALIERYPASDYALVLSNRQGETSRRWREGDLGNTSGHQVLAAIAAGSMWLNLREVHRHDPGLNALLEGLYAELGAAMPGFDARALKMGILISSPRIQVHYHCDLPGQALWQISGRKRVWVYPPKAPFLTPHALEDIAFSGHEFKLQYDPAYDRDALVMDLEPGQMLTWPLNSPHRIDNHDCLNISVTTEHWTTQNRRSQQVSLANAVLRHRLGMVSAQRQLAGPSFWAKWALQAGWRRSPWARQTQQRERPIDFRLDPQVAGAVQDTAVHYR